VAPLLTRAAKSGSQSDVARAYEAFAGMTHLAELDVPTIEELRRVAHKAFMDAYPDLHVAGPDLANPADFRRPFLPGANDEEASATSHPGNFPTSKPLDAADFHRGPLTQNETRPSLMGGSPATAGVKGRTFYTNAAKDEHSAMMGTVHDLIVANYPSVCPISGPGVLADETADRLGTPPEMYGPAGAGGTRLDAKAGGTLAPVEVPAGATKGSGTLPAELAPIVERLVEERVGQQTKALRKELRKVQKRVTRLGNRPDRMEAPLRIAKFMDSQRAGDRETTEKVARAKSLAQRIKGRGYSDSAADAADMEELRGLVDSKTFAALMTEDDD
jgi:hypothetical protein